MQLCVREKVKWHKKAVSVSRWDGESQHYANVKSIKNKSLHAENNEFMVLKWQLIFGRIGKTGGKVLVVVIKKKAVSSTACQVALLWRRRTHSDILSAFLSV